MLISIIMTRGTMHANTIVKAFLKFLWKLYMKIYETVYECACFKCALCACITHDTCVHRHMACGHTLQRRKGHVYKNTPWVVLLHSFFDFWIWQCSLQSAFCFLFFIFVFFALHLLSWWFLLLLILMLILLTLRTLILI